MSQNRVSLSHFEYEGHLAKRFKDLLSDADFTDVTLVFGDEMQIQAHKVILSSCSSFFNHILTKNPHQHPLIYLQGVQYNDMKNLVQFIYTGEVQVAHDNLTNFMRIASELNISGLLENIAFKQELVEYENNEQNAVPEVNFSQDTIEESVNRVEERFNCALCSNEFNNTDDLKKHRLTHKKIPLKR